MYSSHKIFLIVVDGNGKAPHKGKKVSSSALISVPIVIEGVFHVMFASIFGLFLFFFSIAIQKSGIAGCDKRSKPCTSISRTIHASSSSTSSVPSVMSVMSVVILVTFFLLLRLGTFRQLDSDPLFSFTGENSLFGLYNHKETDELVFEVQAM